MNRVKGETRKIFLSGKLEYADFCLLLYGCHGKSFKSIQIIDLNPDYGLPLTLFRHVWATKQRNKGLKVGIQMSKVHWLEVNTLIDSTNSDFAI